MNLGESFLGFSGSLSPPSAKCQLLTPRVPSVGRPGSLGPPPSGGFNSRTKGHLAGPSVEPVWTRLGIWDGAVSFHPGEVDDGGGP